MGFWAVSTSDGKGLDTERRAPNQRVQVGSRWNIGNVSYACPPDPQTEDRMWNLDSTLRQIRSYYDAVFMRTACVSINPGSSKWSKPTKQRAENAS